MLFVVRNDELLNIKDEEMKMNLLLFAKIAVSFMAFALFAVLLLCVVVSCNAGSGDDEELAGKVYVCTSSGSKVWHCKRNCSGLKNCSSEIRETTMGSLRSQYKKPCGICCK